MKLKVYIQNGNVSIKKIRGQEISKQQKQYKIMDRQITTATTIQERT